ncbi:hypothetical protein [Methanocella sp. MCL-LM]|uniref:hypothetical protein n=1 Tax=Methanocella sp. MCL-LM TaxID=3412035 RepID=UPI003C75762E
METALFKLKHTLLALYRYVCKAFSHTSTAALNSFARNDRADNALSDPERRAEHDRQRYNAEAMAATRGGQQFFR